jgi:hypothetical protein
MLKPPINLDRLTTELLNGSFSRTSSTLLRREPRQMKLRKKRKESLSGILKSLQLATGSQARCMWMLKTRKET